MLNSLKVARFTSTRSILRGNLGVVLLTICMMTIVYLNLLFLPSLLSSMIAQTNESLRTSQVGNFTIKPDDGSMLLNDVSGLIEDIEGVAGVTGATARISTGANIIHNDEQTTWEITAIDPDQDKRVFDISKHLIEGEYLSNDGSDQILLGVEAAGADQLDNSLYASSLKDVHAGDSLDLVYNNGVQRTYTVKGIFEVDLIQADFQVFITRDEFDSIVPGLDDKASRIHVAIQNTGDELSTIGEIIQLRDDLKFTLWEESAGIVRDITDSFLIIIRILKVIALIVAAITIFIITYVDLMNKRRQIGIQRAVGITSQSIILSYLQRAAFYALVGVVLGALVFVYIVIPIEHRYPFEFPMGTVYIEHSLPFMIGQAIVIACVAIVSAFIPAWRTIKIQILDAIWGD